MLRALTTVCLLAASAPAQNFLHYKFDSACGTEVINHEIAGPVGNGTFVTSAGYLPWGPGRFGAGMSGSDKGATRDTNIVDTGWNVGSYSGPITFAAWIRNHPGNPATISFGYLFGVDGGNFRCFTGSSGKLFFAGAGPSNIVNANDLTAQLNAGWVHVACVVDDTAQQATWYINGVPDPVVPLNAPVSFGGNTFVIGARDLNAGSAIGLDFDEFLMTPRVVPAGEIQIMASTPPAGVGSYGTGSGATLSANSNPSVGNSTFAVSVTEPNGLLYTLTAGTNRCTWAGTYSLPFDLGAISPSFSGVVLLADTDLASATGPMTTSTVSLTLPIPNNQSLAGITTYWQAIVQTSTGFSTSNALSLGLGY